MFSGSLFLKCKRCKHFNRDNGYVACKAFPDGIPIMVFNGTIDHEKQSYEGDNGIRFEAKE